MQSPITTIVDTNVDAMEALRDDWQIVFAGADCSPFLSWEWMSAWHRWFGTASTPFMIKTYRDDKLIGLLPLRTLKKKIFGMNLTELRFTGDQFGGADHLDLIAAPDDRAEVVRSMTKFLASKKHFDILTLTHISEGSAVASLIKDIDNKSGAQRASQKPVEVCPQIDLSGGWDAILKQSRRASNFKRRLKQLERKNAFEFRSVTAPDETGEAFERFLILHEK